MPRAKMRVSLPLLLALLAAEGRGAPSPAARTEIEHLLTYLAGSGCEFFRNGKWYPAPQARDHLQRKYEYLLKKDLVDSAEQFIERAASESSRSGQAYRVRCANGAPVASRDWLAAELRRLRAGNGR